MSKTKTQKQNQSKPNRNGLLFCLRKCTCSVPDSFLLSAAIWGWLRCCFLFLVPPALSPLPLSLHPGSQRPFWNSSRACVRSAAPTLRASGFCWPSRGPSCCRHTPAPSSPGLCLFPRPRGLRWAYPSCPWHALNPAASPCHSVRGQKMGLETVSLKAMPSLPLT